jgi:hypothetical protein
LVAGVVGLWKRRNPWLLLVVLPILVTFAAATLRQYPFGTTGIAGGRVILFLLPCLVLLIAEGAELMRRSLHKPLGFALFFNLLLVLPLYHALAAFPYSREDPRSVLAHIREQASSSDLLYVDYSARHVFDYYGPRMGLATRQRLNGGCHRHQWREYLRELERLPAGATVWLVFGWHRKLGDADEQSIMLAYMDRIGVRRGGVQGRRPSFWHYRDDYRGAAAFLYEIGADRPDIEEFGPFPEDLGGFATAPTYWQCAGIWSI